MSESPIRARCRICGNDAHHGDCLMNILDESLGHRYAVTRGEEILATFKTESEANAYRRLNSLRVERMA